MNEAFEKHRDKRIREIRESIPDNKFNKKKLEKETFGQRVKKAWKNINEKKPK